MQHVPVPPDSARSDRPRLPLTVRGSPTVLGAAPSRRLTITRTAALSVALIGALWLASRSSYLLFHSLVEIFSIVVACAVFMIAWSSRSSPEARPFLILGIAYLFASILDVFHLLSYEGMGVLRNSTDDATRLWVAARALQAIGTLWFSVLARRRRTGSSILAFVVLGGLAAIAFLTIYAANVFPVCFVEGQGVTAFKKASEYLISAVFAVSILLVSGSPGFVTRTERNLLIAAFGLTIASELVLTLYVSAYGVQNLIGHYLKVAAFYLAYQALFSSKIRGRLELIHELETSTARLQTSELELRNANLTKDKFFSIIAHDLRNPIGGLVTMSEVLARRFDELEPQRVRELCRLIHEGARQGAELLECILEWARAQTGRLEVRASRIRLSELCDGLLAMLEPVASGKNITLFSEVPAEAVAWADENMVAAMLRNLLSNAVKFTPRGGRVAVSSRADGSWQTLTVADSGIGMSPDELAKLFRIDVHFSCPGTEAERGSGMGLILCKELVELNRGSISVTSEPSRGSTFSLRLPREQATAR